MKYSFTLAIILFSTAVTAQVFPVDFEPTGNGGDWTWTVFENDSNPPLEIITNPFPSGINTSQTVAKFTALTTGAPFAGCETMHGADVGTFSLTPDNAFVSIMVYKSVISDVGFKFATNPGASTGEIKIANTLVNQWERLVFDFTPVLGEPSSTDIDQIIVFPDFQARSTENIIYFDNIVFGDSSLSVNEFNQTQIIVSPNPVVSSTQISSSSVVKRAVVYNVLGQQIQVLEPNSLQFTLDMSGLKSGVYTLQMEGENGSSQARLIKQ